MKINITTPQTHISQDNILGYGGKLNAAHYYLMEHQQVPQISGNYSTLKLKKLFNFLIKKYAIKPENYWLFDYSDYCNNEVIYHFCIKITNDVWVVRDGEVSGTFVYYADESPKTLVKELLKIFQNHIEITEVEVENKIFLLYESNDYLYLQDFEVKKNKINLKTNYNDDFSSVHDKIIKRLNTENDKGLVLLHGEPGTGKTSYIRYLTSLVNKKMIYIPSEYADKIASPHFLPLMIANPNSVLIIEDAENIVASREGGTRNAAVSSLLNVADGLLSDCLSLQIVCTFNTHLDNIDKALLRKGRLIANYEFKALSTEKSQALSNSLGFNTEIKENMTLAEIYNQGE
jgi:energy-coupling factor transporter ATP-binding protein EcfA2